MSPRSFGALALGTAVTLVLAGWAVTARDVPAASQPIDGPLFAGLVDQLDQVAVIKVDAGGKKLTIRRDGQVWRVEDRAGYPADPVKVREVARGLAALQLVEAKTATADRLARLDLEDPAAKDAKSKAVTLEDAQGKPVAAAVLGKEKYDLYGSGRGGLYVRRAGEDQAWLAAGNFTLPTEPLDWIDTKLADIPAEDVARVTLAADGPAPIVISKTDRNAEHYALDSVPAGQNPDGEKVDRIASVLESLTMQDVQPISARPMPADAPKARVETWDGLVLTATVLHQGEDEGGESWVTLEATAAAPPAAAASASPDAKPATEAAAGAGAADDATPPKPPLAERVAEMNKRLAGWSFKLPSYLTERLVYTRDDLMAKPGEPDAS